MSRKTATLKAAAIPESLVQRTRVQTPGQPARGPHGHLRQTDTPSLHEMTSMNIEQAVPNDAASADRAPGYMGKILLIAPQPFYQDRGTPIAVQYVLTALTQLGYAVDLLTYPLGSSPKIKGVRYLRVSNPLGFRSIPVSFSWRKLFLDFLILGRLATLLRKERYVYIHAVEESAFLAAALRRIHRTRIVYDMASSLPEQLAVNSLFRFPPLMAVCLWLEKWLLRNVDSVVASAGLKSKVLELSPDADVQEWYFPAERAEIPETEIVDLRTALEISDEDKIIVYTGTFEFYQGIDEVVAAIPTVVAKVPEALFVLVGAKDDDQIEELRARIDPSVTDRVRILPRVKKDQVTRFLAMADILLSPRKVGLNIPLKIFDYLAAARPIVATDIAAHRAIADESLAEIVPADAAGMAAGIIHVLSDKRRAGELAESAASYAERVLSWSAFSGFIESLADRKSIERIET